MRADSELVKRNSCSPCICGRIFTRPAYSSTFQLKSQFPGNYSSSAWPCSKNSAETKVLPPNVLKIKHFFRAISTELDEEKKVILQSIEKTMKAVSIYWNKLIHTLFDNFHIFMLQGISLHKRGENQDDLNRLVSLVLQTRAQHEKFLLQLEYPPLPASQVATPPQGMISLK